MDAFEDSDISGPRRMADAEGTMQEAPLVYALVHALDRAITGEIVFRAPTGENHTVTFFEGAPVRVEPGREDDRIGDDLVALDHLREEALTLALVTARSSRRRMGEILVQAQAVEPKALVATLTMQTVRRLASLANLPDESTFGLYFSARAEPEPFAPWAPLDTLLATIRAWTDRSRLHGTLRWLAGKKLTLAKDSTIDGLLLTSREEAAVAMMRRDAPSLKTLYAEVGKGLSSLLYMLAVTRQFTFTSEKGGPMGRRASSDLVRDLVQVAVPIAPVIAPLPDPAGEEAPDKLSVPPPAQPVAPQVAIPQAPAAPSAAGPRPTPSPWGGLPAGGATPRRRISVRLDPEDDSGPVAPARVVQPPTLPTPVAAFAPTPVPAQPPAAPPPAPLPVYAASPAAMPPPAPLPVSAARPPAPPPIVSPAPAPLRPSFSPPKFVDQGRPPGRIVEAAPTIFSAQMSSEFRLADEASRRFDYDSADRILRENCTDQDMAEPDYQALSAWVKANLTGDDTVPLNDLTFLLMAHNQCESALYYRGLLLKRSGKEKAALRDFVILAKKNPTHVGALSEIKLLRDLVKK